MANPFDFDKDEAQRQFEKNVIFGGDSDVTQTSEFMKVSLAAANMLHDDDQDLDVEKKRDSLNILSSTSIGYSKNDSTDSRAQSARRRPPERPRSDEPKPAPERQSVTGVTFDQSYGDLDDHVKNKPQVSAQEYQQLSSELASAKKIIETLKFERWTKLSIAETVKRMLTEKEYSLEGYKALTEKQELLLNVCKSNDGNAIIVVVLFLERTLNKTLFFRELRKRSGAMMHYVQHLRRNGDLKKLENVYKEMILIEDAAAICYEMICLEEDIPEKIKALHAWVKDYGMKSEASDMAAYIRDEINLLEQQRQIEEEYKKRLASQDNRIMLHPPTASVVGMPVLSTVSYCALYHYDKASKHYPENFKKKYDLNNKQYEWAVLRPRAKLHRWDDISELLTATNILRRKSDFSAIGFEHVCTILHKHHANEEILGKYLMLIGNLEQRIKYAIRFNAHQIAIDTIVQTRDRKKMEEFRLKVDDSRLRQKVNDLLNNTGVKWR